VDACQYPDICHETTDHWGVCPYCRAFKHTDEFGGELDLGNYVSGSGFGSDPMVFNNGDAVNCGNGNPRSSDAYWYCWYDAKEDSDPVPLDSIDMFWLEDPLCHYSVYIYTPMACDFAT